MSTRERRRAGALLYVRVLLLVGIVLSGLVYPFTRLDSGVVGSNGVRPNSFVAKLGRSQELCQGLGTAARMPTSVQLTVGANGVPQPLDVRIKGLGSGTVVRGYSDGVLTTGLPVGTPKSGSVLCVQNRGQRPVSIAGEPGSGAVINGMPRPYAVSLLLTAARRSWSSQTGTIFNRIGFARSELTGKLVVWAMVALLLATLGGTIVTTWRWVR